jgi:hypothetical protein
MSKDNPFRFTSNQYDPSAKPGWNELPEGIACANCALFNGIVSRPGRLTIKVACESARRAVNTTIRPDRNAEGGAWVADGTCMANKLSE